MTLNEYAHNKGYEPRYIHALAKGNAIPKKSILKDMRTRYKSLSEGYYEDDEEEANNSSET